MHFVGHEMMLCGGHFSPSYSNGSYHHQSFGMCELAKWANINIFEGTEATLCINDTTLNDERCGGPSFEQKLAFPWMINVGSA